MADWNVSVEERDLGTSVIDAVAVWGPRHGPAVIVNSVGKYASKKPGRRATLAHEIAHLLFDRDRALPLVDVAGGHVSRAVEQRARAFAAELLAPSDVVGRAFVGTSEPEKAAKSLARRFGASLEVIAWQAKNSGRMLSDDTNGYLRTLVSRPWVF